MAQRKFLDLTGLQNYDTKKTKQINDKIAAGVKSAKDYADSKDDQFEAAGSVATAKTELETKIKANTDAISAINNEETGILKQAKDYTDGKDSSIQVAKSAADAAQATADEVKTSVGTVPEGTTVMDIIENIQENAYDDTKIRGLISDNADAIDTVEHAVADEKSRAEGIEAGLRTDVDAIKDDYLKSTDKTELQTAINSNTTAIETLNGTGDGSVKKTVDDAINKFATDITDDAVVNSYKELIDWVAEHGAEAAEMAAAIEANKTSISDLEKLIGTLPEDATATTIVALIQELVYAEETRAKGIETGFDARIVALEESVTEGGTTADAIESAQSAADAAQKTADEAVEAANKAQGEVDTLEETVGTHSTDITTMKGQIAALEAGTYDDTEVRGLISDNADAISALQGKMTTAESDIDALQASLAEGGETANAIVAAKAAGDNAQKEVDALETVVTTAESNITKNATAITALQSTDTAHADRITSLEDLVGEGCTSIPMSDIDALFNN